MPAVQATRQQARRWKRDTCCSERTQLVRMRLPVGVVGVVGCGGCVCGKFLNVTLHDLSQATRYGQGVCVLKKW